MELYNVDYKRVDKNTKSYVLVTEEKGYSGRLSTLGKVTCFCEYFDEIKIEEQDIKNVIPLENPRESVSFKTGYERAMTLINQGFTRDDYQNFLNSLREKEIIMGVLEIAYNRSRNNIKR